MKNKTRKTAVKKPELEIPEALGITPTLGWAWLLLPIIILGQFMITLGRTAEDPRLIVGVLLAAVGSLVLVWLARGQAQSYLATPEQISQRQGIFFNVVVVLLLLVTSWLNYTTVRIGFAEDERWEFTLMGLPAYMQGWQWWSAYDEPLVHNVNAGLCHLFGLRYDTFKLTAFFFRTGAGIFLWLLARELFGQRIGFWTGVILASSVMYMCSFNTVIKELSVPLVFLACVYFSLRGLRTRSAGNLLIGGLLAGLACYTYINRWAFLAALVCFAFATIIMRERTYAVTNAGKKPLLWLVGLLILATPGIYYQCLYPQASFFSEHATNHSAWHNGGALLLFKDVWLNLLAIVYRGDGWFTSNYALAPMLWWPWACAFWVGIGVMLLRLREARVYGPLLLMAALISFASLNYMYTPNFKLLRAAMLLAIIPAALGVDFLAAMLARGRRWPWLRWAPLLLMLLALGHGGFKLRTVMRNPASWWFYAANPVAPIEDFVFAHPQYRFFGVNQSITDPTPASRVTTIMDLRQVLETPVDGRDWVFLFQAGRQEYQQTLEANLKTWSNIFPGGAIKAHRFPVEGGQWLGFVSYQVPAARVWGLPLVNAAESHDAQAAAWWRRVVLWHKHGLVTEAWRDALQAAHLDPGYYERAEALLGNVSGGLDGRVDLLLKGHLWNEARVELEAYARNHTLGALQQSRLDFLKTRGLEMEVYATYTAGTSIVARLRQYMPVAHAGGITFARAKGQVYAPRDGTYRFGAVGGGLDSAHKVTIDNKIVSEHSRYRAYTGLMPIFLNKGLHAFEVENCAPWRNQGDSPFLTRPPDPLSHLYNFTACFTLQWQIENAPLTLIPPEFLYATGAMETPVPPGFFVPEKK